MATTSTSNIRVLFFDVFGTCVAQRKPVADELHNAAQEALASGNSAMSNEVRANAMMMSYDDWFEFGGEWNQLNEDFKKHQSDLGSVDWKEIDQQRISLLPKMLADRGLVILRQDNSRPSSKFIVEAGSLFNSTKLEHLARIWHRLPPWPDTCRGLELLNKKFITVTLSNTYRELMERLVKQGSIPFQKVYTADMFESYKPNPEVYLGAAEMLGVKPEECALVAAHLSDLRGAKSCGFYAIYVERPLEEKNPELRDQGIPDLVIKEDEGGFVALAERLGIS